MSQTNTTSTGSTGASGATPSSLLYHRNSGGVIGQHTSSFIDFTTKIKQQILANNIKKRLLLQTTPQNQGEEQTTATVTTAAAATNDKSFDINSRDLNITQQSVLSTNTLNGNNSNKDNDNTATITTVINFPLNAFTSNGNVCNAAASNTTTTAATKPSLNPYHTLFASRGTYLEGEIQSVHECNNENTFSLVRDVQANRVGDALNNVCDNNNNNPNNNHNNFRDNGSTSNSRGKGRFSSKQDDQNGEMRLSVPGAPSSGVDGNCTGGSGTPNYNSRTSVYVPSQQPHQHHKVLTNGTLMGTIMQQPPPKPSVTIHVNQCDQNSQQQNDVVNNQSSGVSIVNCYRAVPVQIVHNNNLSENNNINSVDSNDTKLSKNCVNLKVVMDKVNNNNNNNMESEKMNENNKRKIEMNEIVLNKNGQSGENNVRNQMDNNISSEDQQQQLSQRTSLMEDDILTNRTFTSTEAQTDDTILESVNVMVDNNTPSIPLNPIIARIERRRERRERRQARNRQQHNHSSNVHAAMSGVASLSPSLHNNTPNSQSICSNFEILPDILHNHLPPPYTTLPLATPLVPPIISTVPVVSAADCRYTFPLPVIRR